jgi:thioredoxin-related protein
MKTLFSILLSVVVSFAAAAEDVKWAGDVSKAIAQAAKENKMTFILAGREACSNCQATRKMVNEGKVPVTAGAFVIADIDVDNPKSRAEFDRKFKKEKFGNMLPFVVVTDSHGKPVASYSGYKSADDLAKLIEEAKTKAGKK